MKNYRYDVIGAYVDYGVTLHPQADMKRLGFNLVKSEPVPIADCWWFRVENGIDNPPRYIYKMSDDFRFSDERYDNPDTRQGINMSQRKPPEFNPDGSLTDYGKYERGLL